MKCALIVNDMGAINFDADEINTQNSFKNKPRWSNCITVAYAALCEATSEERQVVERREHI